MVSTDKMVSVIDVLEDTFERITNIRNKPNNKAHDKTPLDVLSKKLPSALVTNILALAWDFRSCSLVCKHWKVVIDSPAYVATMSEMYSKTAGKYYYANVAKFHREWNIKNSSCIFSSLSEFANLSVRIKNAFRFSLSLSLTEKYAVYKVGHSGILTPLQFKIAQLREKCEMIASRNFGTLNLGDVEDEILKSGDEGRIQELLKNLNLLLLYKNIPKKPQLTESSKSTMSKEARNFLNAGGAHSLTSLSVRREVSEIPPELNKANFPALRVLELRGNCIEEITPEVCGLTELTTLDLASNHIWKIPPELANLTKTKIDLCSNCLKGAPPEEVNGMKNIDFGVRDESIESFC